MCKKYVNDMSSTMIDSSDGMDFIVFPSLGIVVAHGPRNREGYVDAIMRSCIQDEKSASLSPSPRSKGNVFIVLQGRYVHFYQKGLAVEASDNISTIAR